MERTGIRERHIAGPEMATSDMAVEAARCALAQRGVDAAELNTIIVCTVTPDYVVPLHRVPGAEPPGRAGRLGLRPDRGLLQLRLRADHRRAPGGGRHAPEGAGDRRGYHEPDHRLHRPRHLRAVRRRRRRHAAGTGGGRRGFRLHRFSGRSGRLGRRLPEDARRRQPHAGVARNRGAAAALRQAGRRAGFQVRGAQDVRGVAASCWRATASPSTTSR